MAAIFWGDVEVKSEECLRCGHSLFIHTASLCGEDDLCDCCATDAVALPLGWEKVNRGELIKEGDRYWSGSRWNYTKWSGSRWNYTKNDTDDNVGISVSIYIRKLDKDAIHLPLNLPLGYRVLEVGEVIMKGDLFWSTANSMWLNTNLEGKGYIVASGSTFIRKLDDNLRESLQTIKDKREVMKMMEGNTQILSPIDAMITRNEVMSNQEPPEGYEYVTDAKDICVGDYVWDYAKEEFVLVQTNMLTQSAYSIVCKRILGYRLIDVI